MAAIEELRRVAYVCTDPGIPVFGTKGASVHVQAILRSLARRGVEVHLVCARTGGDVPTDLSGVVLHVLPRVKGDEPAAREIAAQHSDRAVADALDHIVDDGDAGGLDLVYERYALWGRTATAWAKARGVPSLLEVNAPLIEEQRTHRVLVDEPAAQDVARSALAAASGVTCVSDQVATWVRGVAPQARVVVVENGVDTRRVRPAVRDVVGAAEPFTIGFVGTLKPWHGVEQLVEAVALLRRTDADVRLLLVGDGPQATVLEQLAADLGVADVVERTGAVVPEQIPGLLHRMDLATAPYPASDDFYFSPLKIYEYLAAGLPVVASRIGAVPTLLDHGRWGALVEPGDPQALADAIAELRADVDRRRQIREHAPAQARRHDWDRVLERSLAPLDSKELVDATL